MESITTIDSFANFKLIDKNNYFLYCLYDKSGGENNDLITKDGYAKWASLVAKRKITIKEYCNIYPDVSIMTINQAEKLQQKHYEKKYNAFKPYITTKKNYWDKLEVLPPEQFTQNYSITNYKGKMYKYYFESFKLIEAIAENLYNYYGFIKINNIEKYFVIVLPNESAPDVIENYCFKHLAKLQGF
mgnify:FL=1